MRGKLTGRPATIYIIIASGAKGLKQISVACAAHRNYGNASGLRIGSENRRHLKCAHFAKIGGANNRCGSIPLEHGERVGGLRARDDFETLLLQGVSQPFCEVYVAVDQKDACEARRRVHDCTCTESELFSELFSPGEFDAMKASRSSTSS